MAFMPLQYALSLQVFKPLKRWRGFAKVVVVNNIDPGLREENTSGYFHLQ